MITDQFAQMRRMESRKIPVGLSSVTLNRDEKSDHDETLGHDGTPDRDETLGHWILMRHRMTLSSSEH